MKNTSAYASATGVVAAAVLSISATDAQNVAVQVIDARGLPVRDAVVEIAPPVGDSRPLAFPWRNAMAQRDQTFVPGTLIVPLGSNVAFPNLDTVRHSIYSFSRPARFKIDLYSRDQTRSQRFAIAGTVVLGCNIHDQMRGYIRVVSTPYAARTDTNGYAHIAGLGAGRYAVTVWHPRIRANDGEVRQTLALGAAAAQIRVTAS
ncbi:methylamine utilization protein [Novosphingobium sp. FKTRR1]|uniref:methylamine utilization protein n=1 Tax=Novosphingobium sp. FKTRR1 TaxID=2879118 RepID=UPI001CF01153|nr:methylamine utilization protein [Novosphingobium sp. FKTRR1]